MEVKNRINSIVLLALVASNILITMAQLQLLPQDEVESLETIFQELHFEHKNISRTLCSSNEAHNVTTMKPVEILRNISCGCHGAICHVTNIRLMGQNLSGTLPAHFANLSHLKEIELTRNYIDGSIPSNFSKLPLNILSLSDNRISGLISEEIGDIATLNELILEGNNLEGLLPPNLGNLNGLTRLLLSSNNLTGTIPETFGNLKNLTDFRIDGNGLQEKLPGLIGNWTKITTLDMQGTSMEGPIPDSVSELNQLQQLRISNLIGSAATKFPNLLKMEKLEILVLRNCKITGSIPDYIGLLPNLKLLDLSFNMLTGQIPVSLPNKYLTHLFLNSNSLDGAVPNWVSDSQVYVDISYNNFTEPSSLGCKPSRLNAVSSYLSTKSKNFEWCFKKDLPCSTTPKYSTLYINCGGEAVAKKDHIYEADLTAEGPSYFFADSQQWAYSSTGVYMYTDSASYIASNTFSLNVTGPDYYKTARVSPSSLKYYGLCMFNGSYNVRLHFAEIMFSDDQTFSSLGNRIFDIAIQGITVEENFNIAKEAGGVGKSMYRDYTANVTGTTLEIHLYWSGKGSTSVPHRSVYGPLISSISVVPNFIPPTKKGLSVGVIMGIVAGSCVSLAFFLTVLIWKGYLGRKDPEDRELRILRRQTGYFTLRQIKAATNNFDSTNKIGEGGFGPVYKGVLSDGAVIAVKQLSSKSRQGNREFVNEIGMISALHHPNLTLISLSSTGVVSKETSCW